MPLQYQHLYRHRYAGIPVGAYIGLRASGNYLRMHAFDVMWIRVIQRLVYSQYGQ